MEVYLGQVDTGINTCQQVLWHAGLVPWQKSRLVDYVTFFSYKLSLSRLCSAPISGHHIVHHRHTLCDMLATHQHMGMIQVSTGVNRCQWCAGVSNEKEESQITVADWVLNYE